MRIGILGGGQLGRMLALAGYPLNIRSRIYEPAEESSAAQVAERVRGEYDDYRTLFEFIQGLDAVTYEFENVPVETAEWLAERIPVYPPPAALKVSQDRVREKTFLKGLGIPVPEFREVNSREDFDAALQSVGIPSVLKTTRFGYDGKGQAVIKTQADAENAWEFLGGRPLILEAFVPFERELSIVSARSVSGEVVHYTLVENHHRDGMLRRTIAPAPNLAEGIDKTAQGMAEKVLEALGYVGVLAIEFFQVKGELWANEMAPRVHNSGHWSLDGAITSQFENHMRAVAGYDLGQPYWKCQSYMVNLIGDMPTPRETLSHPDAKLHHYGKMTKANRKLGHVTFINEDEDQAYRRGNAFAERYESGRMEFEISDLK